MSMPQCSVMLLCEAFTWLSQIHQAVTTGIMREVNDLCCGHSKWDLGIL